MTQKHSTRAKGDPWPIWYESKPGAWAITEFFGFIYNAILAVMIGVAVLAFWFMILLVGAVMVKIFIALIVGISNPIPFIEQF